METAFSPILVGSKSQQSSRICEASLPLPKEAIIMITSRRNKLLPVVSISKPKCMLASGLPQYRKYLLFISESMLVSNLFSSFLYSKLLPFISFPSPSTHFPYKTDIFNMHALFVSFPHPSLYSALASLITICGLGSCSVYYFLFLSWILPDASIYSLSSISNRNLTLRPTMEWSCFRLYNVILIYTILKRTLKHKGV